MANAPLAPIVSVTAPPVNESIVAELTEAFTPSSTALKPFKSKVVLVPIFTLPKLVPLGMAARLPNLSVPALRLTPLEKVLALPRVSVPAPFLPKAPAPLTTPDRVTLLPLSSTVAVAPEPALMLLASVKAAPA